MRGQMGEQSLLGRSMRPLISGVITGILAGVVLLLLFSALVSVKDIPQSMIDPMAIFSLCVGAFVAGFRCSRVVRSRGLVYGAFSGVMFSVVVIFAGMISGAGGIGMPTVFRCVFILLCAMIGGVLGVNVRKRRS